MPQPGSHAYDLQKQKLRHKLEQQGVDDETAEEVAEEAMKRAIEAGESEPRPTLPRRRHHRRTRQGRRTASPTISCEHQWRTST